jgi:penicillin-binding protein 1C
MVRAFAVFPRSGQALDLRFTENQEKSETRQLMSPYSAWIITDILSDRASRYTGFGPAPALATEFPSMFKTGTANQFQHIWALGATAHYTVGVWMGNFSGETVIGRTGSSIPANIAADLLRALEQTAAEKSFPRIPSNAREIQVCSLSGMAVGPACTGSVREWLLADAIPCTWHRQAGAAPEYPGEYQAWLAERFRRGAVRGESGNVRIRLPVSGSVFYYDSALPSEAQAIRVETAGFSGGALVYANEILQGSLNHAGVFALPLSRGFQRITVEDDKGFSTIEIEVR